MSVHEKAKLLQESYPADLTIFSKGMYVPVCFNKLSQQVFVANTEMQMQDGGIFLSPFLQGWMKFECSPCPEDGEFFMQGQMLLKQMRPSASLSVAWRARS
jgi:hypothetical protein